MDKKKIILIAIALIVAITAIAIGNSIIKKNNDDVREYEVVGSDEESDYVSLKTAKSIDVSSFMKELGKMDNDEKELTYTFLKKYSGMNDVLNIIKDYDKTFSESNYNISYNLPYDDKNSGNIYITYYITDNKPTISSSSSKIEYTQIETNKSYMLTIDKGKIDYISLAGVRKDNLDKINTTDNQKLIETANDFKGNKKEKALLKKDKQKIFNTKNILDDDNTIKKSALPDDVISYNESFLFDYNTNKLKYRFLTTVKFGEGHSIEIDLN